jgi:hypothetical protein
MEKVWCPRAFTERHLGQSGVYRSRGIAWKRDIFRRYLARDMDGYLAIAVSKWNCRSFDFAPLGASLRMTPVGFVFVVFDVVAVVLWGEGCPFVGVADGADSVRDRDVHSPGTHSPLSVIKRCRARYRG